MYAWGHYLAGNDTCHHGINLQLMVVVSASKSQHIRGSIHNALEDADPSSASPRNSGPDMYFHRVFGPAECHSSYS